MRGFRERKGYERGKEMESSGIERNREQEEIEKNDYGARARQLRDIERVREIERGKREKETEK
eukprot:269487-Amorphochlora_amoeboformis.AAC.1